MRANERELPMLRSVLYTKLALTGWTYAQLADAAGVPAEQVRELFRARDRTGMRNDYFDRMWAVGTS